MNDLCLVQVVVRLEDLVDDGFYSFNFKAVWRCLQFLEQSLLNVIKDEE